MPISEKLLFEKVASSDSYREYQRAFQAATGLPLELTQAGSLRFALCSKSHGNNEFCKMMSGSGAQCDTCRLLNIEITEAIGLDSVRNDQCDAHYPELTRKSPQTMSRILSDPWQGPKTFECFAGMCETMVPIRVESKIAGFLKTGQVLLHEPSHQAFRQAVQKMDELLTDLDLEKIEEAYFKTPVVPPVQYEAMVTLLRSFAEQIAEQLRKTVVDVEHSSPAIVRKAKLYIDSHFQEPIKLETVARAVNVSPFHLSREFKSSCHMGFLEYLARIRIEHAKGLLRKKDLRVSEVAYQSGFQSLAPFNRAFQQQSGMTPRAYRQTLTH
jgi:AraC-like DNA-binding protein